MLLGCALLLPQDAHAHMMPAQQGTVNILGKSAFVVVSIPVAAFDPQNDDDRDGGSPIPRSRPIRPHCLRRRGAVFS